MSNESEKRDHLTPREIEVWQHVAKGASNREIADELGLSTHTVSDYITNIYNFFGFESRNVDKNPRVLVIFKAKEQGMPTTDQRRPLLDKLSRREVEVLQLLSQGYTTAAVAKILVISERTAGNHSQNICNKIGAANKYQAIAWALESDLLDPIDN